VLGSKRNGGEANWDRFLCAGGPWVLSGDKGPGWQSKGNPGIYRRGYGGEH